MKRLAATHALTIAIALLASALFMTARAQTSAPAPAAGDARVEHNHDHGDHDHGEHGDHDHSEQRAAHESPGKILFYAQNDGYKAEGEFKKWRFTEVNIPEDNPLAGHVELEIDLDSIWEKADKLANHLKQHDFFDVAKYPTAKVRVDQARRTAEGDYVATATLHVREVTARTPVRFKVVRKAPLTIEGATTVNREQLTVGEPYVEGKPRSIEPEVSVKFSTIIPPKAAKAGHGERTETDEAHEHGEGHGHDADGEGHRDTGASSRESAR